MRRKSIVAMCVLVVLALAAQVEAARLEADAPSQQSGLLDRSHEVRVVISGGFAMTEVRHTFENTGGRDVAATYSFPLPKSASLSELSILSGEREIHGEVLPRKEAERIFEEESEKGNDAGLASKHGYQDFSFAVSPVRAGQQTTIRFVYYQPIELDTGIGRYLYPLEDGGTDEGDSFWKREVTVAGSFTFSVLLKSACPVADVRLPGLEQAAQVEKKGEGHYVARFDSPQATLNRDVVFYYRLADGLPGRVELVPYREGADKPGTFMLVVTPGLDLGEIKSGADYSFVLDVSSSMEGKLGTLIRGVVRTLEELNPEDRFRIVTFNDCAQYLGQSFAAATPSSVRRATAVIERLEASGSTNLYEGLRLGLAGLDADRAQSVVLVTDGVTNTGVIDPVAFDSLMKKVDVRAFGFLMGNCANWPLMEAICDASGGFWAQVSNADDILGQLMLAKSKVTHECLHDADLRISGVKTFETTDGALGKVYRGQQLVLFGKYDKAGTATVTLKARLTGEDKVYRATFDFPEADTENPEIERLWALHRIEAIEAEELLGKRAAVEAEQAVRDLGVAYQIVTDHTSMVVLSDEVFAGRGIERNNLARVAKERKAQAERATRAARNRRVDGDQPMFGGKAPRIGGGALDPLTLALVLGLVAAAAASRRRRRRG